jgi:molybdopterin-guanine dinucleotide biosynthesis protein MobB
MELKPSMPVVSFVGNSNSGKTTLVVQIVGILRKLGYRVATVKHAAHGFDIDRPGKDSYRFREAGSDVTVISSPTQLALVKDMNTEATLSQIIDLIGTAVDIILVEGYQDTTIPKIVVITSDNDTGILIEKQNILAVLIASVWVDGIPKFADRDISNIVHLLVDFIIACQSPKCTFNDYVEYPGSATNQDRGPTKLATNDLDNVISLPKTPLS